MPNTSSPFPDGNAPRRRNWFERLTRRARPDLAEQALAAAFAARSPFRVTEREVMECLEDYSTRGREAHEVGMRLWGRALRAFVEDDAISDAEVQYLERLARLLDIGFDDAAALSAEIVHPRFVAAASRASADGAISREERRFLEDLLLRLRIPTEAVRDLMAGPVREAALRRLAEMTADRRLSPDELEAIARLGSDLGGRLTFDAETEVQFARFAELWRIENGTLPQVQAPIALQRGEVCHFVGECEWWEHRTRTRRIDYAGPVVNIRIMKGFRYRAGSITPQRVTTEELTRVEAGTVVVTSKRVIVRGQARNMALGFSSLIGVVAYADAVQLEKARGRSPYLMMPGEDVERLLVIFTSLLARSA